MSDKIFILSSSRSGTTALSNHLCQHKDIFGLQAEQHWGIMEFKFISELRFFFDNIKEDLDYFSFLQVFSRSDLFTASGLSSSLFLVERPKNIIEFVDLFILECLKKHKSKYWLNNDPRQAFYVKDLIQRYPDSYFIYMRRPIIDTVKSNTKKFTGRNISGFAQKVFRYHSDHDSVRYYRSHIKNFYEVTNYNNNSKRWAINEKTLREIIDFLDIKWDNSVLKHPYSLNSSFGNKDSRSFYFGNKEVRLVKFLDMLFSLLPHKFIKFPIGNYWDRNKMKNYKFYPFNYRLSEEAPYFNSENFLREDSKNLKSKIYNF